MEDRNLIHEDTVKLPSCNVFITYEDNDVLEFDYVSVIKKSLQSVLDCITCPKTETFECSIKFTGIKEIQELNKEYRGKDLPTNVLSFEYDIEDELALGEEFIYIGDIAIAVPVLKQQAQDQNKTVESHLTHLVVHSILHLFGFDHIEENQALRMEELEIKILQSLGINNPYIIEEEK